MMTTKLGLLIALSVLFAGCAEEDAVLVSETETPARPDVIATNAFYYYNDVESAWSFYRDILGVETVVDYGFAKIVRMADSSYLTLVQASEAEILYGDAIRYVNKAVAAGSPARLQSWPYMVHVWQFFYPRLTEAGEAWDEIGKFIAEVDQGQ